MLASGLLFLGLGDVAAIDFVFVPRYLADGATRGDSAGVRLATAPSRASAAMGMRPLGEALPVPAVDTGALEVGPARGPEEVAPSAVAASVAASAPAPPTTVTPSPDDFPDLLFAINTTWLSPVSRQTLDSVADALAQNPDRRVILGGHTDGAGDPDFNRALSRDRARRAARYLHARGVDIARIEVQAFGSQRPIEGGPSAAPRARNRRVEISVQ